MSRFFDLLKATVKQCNRQGRTLAIAVLAFGVLTILGQVMLLKTVSQEALWQSQRLLTAEQWKEVTMKIEEDGGTGDPVSVLRQTLPALERRVKAEPETERGTFVANAVAMSARRAWQQIFLTWLLLLSVWLYGRVFFLALGSSHGVITLKSAAMQALRCLPSIIAIALFALLITLPWPFLIALIFLLTWPVGMPLLLIGFYPALMYLPRLALAPAVLVEDRVGVVESIRRSLRGTAGKWLKIVGNFLGVGAVVWMGTAVAQMVINGLMYLSSAISAAAWWISSVMAFVTVLGMAYRMIFAVKLKQAVITSTSSGTPPPQ